MAERSYSLVEHLARVGVERDRRVVRDGGVDRVLGCRGWRSTGVAEARHRDGYKGRLRLSRLMRRIM